MNDGPPNGNLSRQHHLSPGDVCSRRLEVFAEARQDFVLLGEQLHGDSEALALLARQQEIVTAALPRGRAL